jgi:sigma-B regulation protein RsbU (phosphoserine phosphatase)
MSGEAEGLDYLELATANPLLGQMTERALKSLMTGSVVVEIGANEHLIRQGAPSDAAYLLVDGEVDVLVENSYGPVHMARLSAGAVVGEIGVFTDLPRNASVVAIGPARALRLARDDILAAGNDSPRFLRSIMSTLGRHIYTYNHAIAFFTNALAAIEQRNFDLRLLNDLMYPVPELIKFSQTFRRIAEQIMLRQAHNKDMDSAAAIQRAFLPAPNVTADRSRNVEIHAEMRPAKEVGGDLYDFFFIDEDRFAVTIGDVVGKGVPASLFMAVTQSLIRMALRQGHVLAEQINVANDVLVSYNKETLFVTLFCAVIDLPSGVMTYCNCGHNPPLLVRKSHDAFECLKATGAPMGLDAGADYSTREICLAPDDCLVLFTDGITEAMNGANEQYGELRLQQTVRQWRELQPRALVDHIIDAARAFAGEAPQSDDMACLALVYRSSRCGENNGIAGRDDSRAIPETAKFSH